MSELEELSESTKRYLAEEAGDHDFSALKPRVAARLEQALGVDLGAGSVEPSAGEAVPPVERIAETPGAGRIPSAAGAPETASGVGLTLSGGKLVTALIVSLAVGAGVGVTLDRAQRAPAVTAPGALVAAPSGTEVLPNPTSPDPVKPNLGQASEPTPLPAGAEPRATSAPAVAPAPAAPGPAAAHPAPPVNSAAPSAGSAAPEPTGGTPASDLRRERALIDAARAALAHGNTAAALDAVRRHEQAFPQGQLKAEREAIKQLASERAR